MKSKYKRLFSEGHIRSEIEQCLVNGQSWAFLFAAMNSFG